MEMDYCTSSYYQVREVAELFDERMTIESLKIRVGTQLCKYIVLHKIQERKV